MRAYMIIDGQWGSSGKGALAGKLALDRKPNAVVCNFGPDSSQTFRHAELGTVVTRQIPTGLVNLDAELFIGPGAVIDPEALWAEVLELDPEWGIADRLHIHPRAAVVSEADRHWEAENLQPIASALVGNAPAMCRKILRGPSRALPRVAAESRILSRFVTSAREWESKLFRPDALVQIEATKGFEQSLSRALDYPHCAGRDITPEQVLSDVSIPHRYLQEVIAVIRTYPVKTGSNYGPDGEFTGNSGPVWADMDEITWKDLSDNLIGLGGHSQQEREGAYRKVRRLFTFSETQYSRMLEAIGPNTVFLNYINYLEPLASNYQECNMFTRAFIRSAQKLALDHFATVGFLGFGPRYDQLEGVTGGLL